MDDLRPGEQGTELFAAGQVLLHDHAADPGLEEAVGQIIADPAAAAEHDPPDLPGEDAQVFQQGSQVFGQGGDEQPVALPQCEVAAGGGGGTAPKHGTDQDLALDNGPQVSQLDVAQLAFGVYPQLYDFCPALGEGIPPEKAGVFQQPVDFRSGLVFGVDEHGQAEEVPHFEDLLGVLRIPDPGDGVQLRVHRVGGGAAQQIDFVRACGGDQQIRRLHTGLTQHLHRGAVALDGDHVVALHAVFQPLELGVDDRHVVALSCKLAGQGSAYLAVTRNDNIHSILPVSKNSSAARFKKYSLL